MSGKIYLKNRLPFLLVNLLSMIGLSLFLLSSGNHLDSILFVLSIWIFLLSAGLIYEFLKRKKQLNQLLEITRQLEERYLISQIMEKPERADDLVFYHILKLSGKSMLEQINKVRLERMEYKDYIEQWIHEVKTPITAMKLICENNRTPAGRELLTELEKINRFTEQTLYYARSENTQKDYFIREISLFDVVHQAIADNKHLLLQHNVRIELEQADAAVYSDDKWIRFILNQLIVNAVKYRSRDPVLRFFTVCGDGQTSLFIQDNGIGICESDLPRIFEKGFTGENGRSTEHSTGIGLYLCRRLCDKLGLLIRADSNPNGTVFQISFPIHGFINQVQD